MQKGKFQLKVKQQVHWLDDGRAEPMIYKEHEQAGKLRTGSRTLSLCTMTSYAADFFSCSSVLTRAERQLLVKSESCGTECLA